MCVSIWSGRGGRVRTFIAGVKVPYPDRLDDAPILNWWASEDSNLKSSGYEPGALASYARGPIRKEVGDCYAVLNPDGTIFKKAYDSFVIVIQDSHKL